MIQTSKSMMMMNAGTRTRVCRVKADYPSRLDYMGWDAQGLDIGGWDDNGWDENNFFRGKQNFNFMLFNFVYESPRHKNAFKMEKSMPLIFWHPKLQLDAFLGLGLSYTKLKSSKFSFS